MSMRIGVRWGTCLVLLAAAAQAGEISGVVRDVDTQQPVAGALVSLQATDVQTTTDANGAYTLDVPAAQQWVIVAARKGYFNESSYVAAVPASGVDIDLEAVPQSSDPTYPFVPPATCSACHLQTWLDWNGSPMQKAGTNTWVHDIFSGTGTPGGMGGFVYTRDSIHAAGNPASECASCHQPELWIANGFHGAIDDDLVTPSPAVAHGISCDTCHKIADIDPAQVNYPGIVPGAVTYTQPAGPGYLQVQYGALADVDYDFPSLMRASYQPQLRSTVCAACHQDKNDPDADGLFEEANGVLSEPTYLEWLASPYGDPQSAQYRDCVDCHMPPSGQTLVCDVLAPPLERDPATIRSHRIVGTTPEFLENAVELSMDVSVEGRRLLVEVEIDNAHTGHHVPTGVTIRNMILLVEAWKDGDDPLTEPLRHLGTQVVHDLGGVGDPAQGYYAGLPGKYFSKRNHNAQGQGPTFFTDATGILWDNRIPALGVDTTSYPFLLPATGGSFHVRARLIYRRSFRFLTDAKGWTEDGHGNPLADVAPPHFGHLMESAQATLVLEAPVQTSRPGADLAGGPETHDPPAPLPETPGALQLSGAGGVLRVIGAPPIAPLRLRIWNGRDPDGAAAAQRLDGFVSDRFGELELPLPRDMPPGLVIEVELAGVTPPRTSRPLAFP